jgi:PAS domain-containing protein
MIAETLAGIALVKSAVDGIKSAIGTANDIGDIAGQIDALFAGQKQVNEARNKKSGVGIGDQFGVESVAREVLDAKIAAERLQEVASMVDMRFGPGTWRGIVDERAKRIQEAKEAEAARRRAEKLRQQEMIENAKIGIAIFALVTVVVGLFIAAIALSG